MVYFVGLEIWFARPIFKDFKRDLTLKSANANVTLFAFALL